MSDPSLLAVEEYRALRATIRERGTIRLIVTVLTFVAWSALAVAVQTLFALPVMTLVPLMMLAIGFEVVFAAHVGVERIGRYLYVHHESFVPHESADRRAHPYWEHAISQMGPRANSGSGLDPLFAIGFITAAILNLVPALIVTTYVATARPGGRVLWSALFAFAHALFIARVFGAKRFAARQRPLDTELFQKAAGPRS
jgi:hypothetical protein